MAKQKENQNQIECDQILDTLNKLNISEKDHYTDEKCYAHGYMQGYAGAICNNPFIAGRRHDKYQEGWEDGDKKRISQLPLSQFAKFYHDDLNAGSFQTLLFKTWIAASEPNKEKLLTAFPDRFNERDLTLDY